jgi:hypothetical protein
VPNHTLEDLLRLLGSTTPTPPAPGLPDFTEFLETQQEPRFEQPPGPGPLPEGTFGPLSPLLIGAGPFLSPLHEISADPTTFLTGESAESTPAIIPGRFAPDLSQPVTRADIAPIPFRPIGQRVMHELEAMGRDPAFLALSLLPEAAVLTRLARAGRLGRNLAPGFAGREGIRTGISEFPPVVRQAPRTAVEHQRAAARISTIASRAEWNALTTETAGTKFVRGLRQIDDVADEVVTTENPVIQAILGTFINPSVALNTQAGKILTAYYRQRVAIGELIETSLGAALDSHAQAITGRLPVRISQDGFVEGTGKLWNDVFSRPGDFNLNAAQRAFVDDYHRVVDEMEAFRIEAGLEPIGKRTKEGWFYVPRQVKEARGVSLRRPTNAKLQRFFEEATEGHAAGIRYDADPRATLASHMRAAYNEILQKQLSNVLEPLSIRPSQLISEAVRLDASNKAKALQQAEREVNRLKVPRVEKGAGGRQTAAERALRNKLNTQRAAAQKALREARIAYAPARTRYKTALAKARESEFAPGNLFGRAEDSIPIATWRGRFLPREDADLLSEALGGLGTSRRTIGFEALARRGARGFELVGNQVRFLSAVGDFAEPFIQGLPVLATNPRAWARATALHYQAFFNPRVQARFIREHIDTFLEMAQHGVPVGDPEFFIALRPGQGFSTGKLLELLPKGAEARRFLQAGGRQTFGRFQASYNTGLGSARALLWESMKPSWQGSLDELAAYVRNLTGGLDARALAVGPSQRGFESTFMAFSPRLLRSTVALVSDAVQGVVRTGLPGASATVRQQASMRTIGQFIAGVHGVYVISGLALGKNWDEIEQGLNPLNGKKYLSHLINDDWVGVGGQIRAILQFQANLGAAIVSGNAGDLLSRNMFDNPILQMVASRGAVGLRMTGTVVEGLSGGKIDALPYEHIDSIPKMFLHLGKSTLAFALQGQLDGDGAVGTVLGLGGMRTSPQTPAEELNELRQQEMDKRELTGKFRDVDPRIQREIDAVGGDQIGEAKERAQKRALERGSEFAAYRRDLTTLTKEYEDTVDAAFARMLPNAQGRAFRGRLRVLQRDLHLAKEDLKEQYAEALEFLDEMEPSESAFARDLDRYITVLEDIEFEDPITGDFDYLKREAILGDLRKPEELGTERVAEIQRFLQENDPEPIKLLRADREVLKSYFSIERNIMRKAGIEEKYDKYLAQGPFFAAGIRAIPENADLDSLLTQVAELKRRIRDSDSPQNLEIRRRLFFWGYGHTPTPEQIPGLAEQFRERVGAR